MAKHKKSSRRGRKNPTDSNHPGLWAAAGSAIGSVPGAAFQMPGMSLLGSIAGGAVGGYFGADDDRKGRGLLGGGIGGVAGFLGAGLGGWIGGRKPDSRNTKKIAALVPVGKKKRNPGKGMSVAVLVGAGAVALGAGYYSYKKLNALPAGKKDILEDDPMALSGNDFLASRINKLGGLILATADMENAPPDAVVVPAFYSYEMSEDGKGSFKEARSKKLDRLVVDSSKGVVVVESMGAGGPEATVRYEVPGNIADLVLVDIDLVSAHSAHELAAIEVANGLDWKDDAARDEATKSILAKIASGIDWSEGLKPYTYASPEWRMWNAVQLLGGLADLQYRISKQQA